MALMLSLWAGSASAAPLELSPIEAVADDVLVRAEGYVRQVDPSVSSQGVDPADRFDQALVHRMLSQWNDAARLFWILDDAGALDSGPLGAEVDFYLGESLDEAGYPVLAAEAYRRMVDAPQHPFRDEATRHLLDLYLQLGDASAFDQIYQREVVSGRLTIDDATRYDVGRLLLQQGDLDTSTAYFEQIQPTASAWAKAQYHLGTIGVSRGTDEGLDAALVAFTTLTDPEAPVAESDRQIVDLAWLGIARIHQARGELLPALDAYSGVADDSPYRVEQLYELVWTFSRVGEWDLAASAVELFMLTYPDHPAAAEIQLTRGHLAYRESREEEALARYTEVVEALDPLSRRFGDLLDSRAETVATLHAIARGQASEVDVLPAYGVSLVMEDAAFVRAVDLTRDVQQQALELEATEAIRDRVRTALGAGQGEDTFDMLGVRRGIVQQLVRGVQARLDTLAAEARWLESMEGGREAIAGATTSRLQAVSTFERLEPAFRGAEAASTSEIATMEGRIADLRALDASLRNVAQSQRAARVGVGIDLRLDPDSARVDGLHGLLDAALEALFRASERAPTATRSAVADLIDRFRAEDRAVRQERHDHATLVAASEEVGIAAGHNAFATARATLDQTIMGAEMGIVNIFWTRWVRTGEESERVKNERNTLVDALEDRYGLIRQTLGPARTTAPADPDGEGSP